MPLSPLQNYTQYIPLSVYDLQTWMGSPSIYVYDCSNAGLVIKSFHQFAEQHEKEYEVSYFMCVFYANIERSKESFSLEPECLPSLCKKSLL
jgi:hypothetical protein